MLGHMSEGKVKNSSLCSHLGGSSLSLETFWRHNNYAGYSLVGNVMPGRYVIFHSGSFSDLCDSDHYEGVKLLLITDILQDYGTIHAEVEPRQLNTHLPSQQSILPCSYGGCLQLLTRDGERLDWCQPLPPSSEMLSQSLAVLDMQVGHPSIGYRRGICKEMQLSLTLAG